MPSYKEMLSDEEKNDLIAYLKTLWDRARPTSSFDHALAVVPRLLSFFGAVRFSG